MDDDMHEAGKRARSENNLFADLNGDDMSAAVAAGISWDVYRNYLGAGFDAKQALYLTACVLTENPLVPPMGA